MWAQEFYMVDGFVPRQDEFTKESGPEIPIIPHDRYYDPQRFPSEQELVVPDSLPRMLTRFSGLSSENRRRFIQAAQWISVASALWDHQISSYYIALISAIESLSHKTILPDPCPTWRRDRSPGPTQRFRSFVEKYVSSHAETKKGRLYTLRSKLLHGEALFQSDERPWDFTFNTTSMEEWNSYTELAYVVRQVMVNWILAN